MSRNLTILHALAPARTGGLESVVVSLVGGLADRGHDVHVAAVTEPDAADHEFVDAVRDARVPVDPVRVPHRAYRTEARCLDRIVDRIEPDVVHTHGYRGDVVAGTVARRAGRPVVSTVHGFTGGGLRNRFYEWIQRRALRRFDAVAAVSEPIRRTLTSGGLDASRVHLVRNAYARDRPPLDRGEARKRLGLPPGCFAAGWVGRVSHEKGPDVFLEAFVRLARGHDGMVAAMIGDGPEASELRTRLETVGPGIDVRMLGFRPRAAELYPAFDVFVLSSRTEGTPVSLFEAMDAGVPVVTTRVGGVPDVVTDGEEALVVPPEAPDELADAMERVYRDRDAAMERARRARRRLRDDFAAEPWVERYERIYRRVVRP